MTTPAGPTPPHFITKHTATLKKDPLGITAKNATLWEKTHNKTNAIKTVGFFDMREVTDASLSGTSFKPKEIPIKIKVKLKENTQTLTLTQGNKSQTFTIPVATQADGMKENQEIELEFKWSETEKKYLLKLGTKKDRQSTRPEEDKPKLLTENENFRDAFLELDKNKKSLGDGKNVDIHGYQNSNSEETDKDTSGGGAEGAAHITTGNSKPGDFANALDHNPPQPTQVDTSRNVPSKSKPQTRQELAASVLKNLDTILESEEFKKLEKGNAHNQSKNKKKNDFFNSLTSLRGAIAENDPTLSKVNTKDLTETNKYLTEVGKLIKVNNERTYLDKKLHPRILDNSFDICAAYADTRSEAIKTKFGPNPNGNRGTANSNNQGENSTATQTQPLPTGSNSSTATITVSTTRNTAPNSAGAAAAGKIPTSTSTKRHAQLRDMSTLSIILEDNEEDGLSNNDDSNEKANASSIALNNQVATEAVDNHPTDIDDALQRGTYTQTTTAAYLEKLGLSKQATSAKNYLCFFNAAGGALMINQLLVKEIGFESGDAGNGYENAGRKLITYLLDNKENMKKEKRVTDIYDATDLADQMFTPLQSTMDQQTNWQHTHEQIDRFNSAVLMFISIKAEVSFCILKNDAGGQPLPEQLISSSTDDSVAKLYLHLQIQKNEESNHFTFFAQSPSDVHSLNVMIDSQPASQPAV